MLVREVKELLGCEVRVKFPHYTMNGRGKRILMYYIPRRGVLLSIEKGGVCLIEEKYKTWDYENRPDGVSETQYMIAERFRHVKRAVSKTRTFRVKAANIVGLHSPRKEASRETTLPTPDRGCDGGHGRPVGGDEHGSVGTHHDNGPEGRDVDAGPVVPAGDDFSSTNDHRAANDDGPGDHHDDHATTTAANDGPSDHHDDHTTTAASIPDKGATFVITGATS